MILRMLIMLLLVSTLAGFFYWFKTKDQGAFMGAGEPPQTVSTIIAQSTDWLPKLEAVGSLTAVQGVEISNEVPGIVSQINFNEGEDVNAGTPLLQLRHDDDTARLKSLMANAELARITYQRDLAQLHAKTVSQQVVDTDKASLNIALANVAEQQALIDKKTIRAPFSGRLGVRQANSGQYLQAGATIVTLQDLDTLYLDFYLPQQNLAALQLGQAVTITSDSYPGQSFTGKITVINPKVEVQTRNVLVRATLNNSGRKLLPGMYALANIAIGQAERHLTLPRSALTFNAYGSTVFRVETSGIDAQGKPKMIAKQTFVTTGATRGDQIAIIKGLNEGDTVVSAGQIKLHNDSVIIVDNSVQPSNDPAPQPIDQ